MIYRLGVLAWLFAFALFLQAFADRPIPRHKPDGDSRHDSQPEWCQSTNRGGYQANCHCKGMGGAECKDELPGATKGGGETSSCSVYCRRTSCGCTDPCQS